MWPLAQNYLRLLHSGKLASKKKEGEGRVFPFSIGPLKRRAEMNQATHACTAEVQSKIDQTSLTMRSDEPRSVFDMGLSRMGATTSSLDVAPVSRPVSIYGGPRSSSSSPLGRSASAERFGRPASQPVVGRVPHNKVFTPGPGAYTPANDRFGMMNTTKQFSFGSAKQRPQKIGSYDATVSPGPVYLPRRTYTSTISSPPRSS